VFKDIPTLQVSDCVNNNYTSFTTHGMAVWHNTLVVSGATGGLGCPVVYKYESGTWTQLGSNLSVLIIFYFFISFFAASG
jgi:hypothetical protein